MRSLLALAAVLVLTMALFLALRGGREVEALRPDSVEAPAGGAGTELPVEELAAAGSEANRSPEVSIPAEIELPGRVPADLPKLARVHGRFVLAGGAPAPGVKVWLHGSQASPERAREHGLPGAWLYPYTTTDADGRFELSFHPPRAFAFTLTARLAGSPTARWNWTELLPGSETDLGIVELVAAGTVLVRMEDREGRAIRSGWRIHAEGLSAFPFEGHDATRADAGIRRATGIARLEGLVPGKVKLSAYSEISNRIDGPTVEVVAGQEVEATLRYTGPDESGRIVVDVSTRLFHTLEVDAASIRLTGPGIEARHSTKMEGSSQSYSFDDLAPGSYSVEIDDPRFEPWSQHGVGPGTSVNAKLRGSAALQLTVVDAASGEALLRYDLRARLDKSNRRPNVFQLLEPGRKPPAGGLHAGLPPMELSLLVAAEGFAELELELALGELAPNETRTVVASLVRGASLRGRVVLSDASTPVAGAQVQLVPTGTAAGVLRQGSWSGSDEPERAFWTETDESGRFELLRTLPGTWALRAIASPWSVETLDPFVLAEGVDRELELVLPPSGSLRGRLITPEGASQEGLQLFVEPDLAPVLERRHRDHSLLMTLAASGNFESRPLPPGAAAVWLSGPEVMLPMGFGASIGARIPRTWIAALEIRSGPPTEAVLDARAHWPGSIRVRATHGGAPLGGHVAEAVCSDGRDSWQSGAITAADGTATIQFLTAGDWQVSLRPVEGRWSVQAPQLVRVEAGRESACSIEVLIVKGSVLVVDRATGAALLARKLWLRGEDGRISFQHSTDEQGRLELEIPVGIYTLDAGAGAPAQAASLLEWTVSGPTAERVEVEVPATGG